jgi:hypothetical protein
MTEPLTRPGPCPRCDDDHIQATCLAPFGVYGGCKSARVAWDAGHTATATNIDALVAERDEALAEIARLKAAIFSTAQEATDCRPAVIPARVAIAIDLAWAVAKDWKP